MTRPLESALSVTGIEHLVSGGDRVIDVGASTGLFTLYLAHVVGPAGRVTSIEGIPENFDILAESVGGIGNVELIHCDISDRDDFSFEIPVHLHENTRAAGAVTPRGIKLGTRKLDSLSSGASFIRVDAEGRELECLRGAQGIIEQSRPSWLIELWGDIGQDGSGAHEVVRFMERFGYRAHTFDGTYFRPRTSGSALDCYFLAPAHQAALERQSRFHI